MPNLDRVTEAQNLHELVILQVQGILDAVNPRFITEHLETHLVLGDSSSLVTEQMSHQTELLIDV